VDDAELGRFRIRALVFSSNASTPLSISLFGHRGLRYYRTSSGLDICLGIAVYTLRTRPTFLHGIMRWRIAATRQFQACNICGRRNRTGDRRRGGVQDIGETRAVTCAAADGLSVLFIRFACSPYNVCSSPHSIHTTCNTAYMRVAPDGVSVLVLAFHSSARLWARLYSP